MLNRRQDLRLKPPSETKVVQPQIVDLFRRGGCECDSTSQYRASHIACGFPDLVVFARVVGLMFFFEVKSYLAEWTSPTGLRIRFDLFDERTWRPKLLEPDQVKFREKALACNQLHFWGGLPQARDALVQIGLGYRLPSGQFCYGRPR